MIIISIPGQDTVLNADIQQRFQKSIPIQMVNGKMLRQHNTKELLLVQYVKEPKPNTVITTSLTVLGKTVQQPSIKEQPLVQLADIQKQSMQIIT